MPTNVPHAVAAAQPMSVALDGYRWLVASNMKKLLSARVMDAVRARNGDDSLDRTKCETALRKLGVKPGNAQRILDDTTDVRIGTVVEVAAKLGVGVVDLLGRAGEPAPAAPPTLPTPGQVLGAAFDAIENGDEKIRLFVYLESLISGLNLPPWRQPAPPVEPPTFSQPEDRPRKAHGKTHA